MCQLFKATSLGFRMKDNCTTYIRDPTFPHAPRLESIAENDVLSIAVVCPGDLSSELPRTSPTPNETAAKGSHDTNRALVHDFVNIIPQVTEGREEEDLAEQITLAHRRYIVAASAEFKKLVFSGEQSETVSTFHYMTSGTTPPSESRFIRSLRSTVRHRNPTPQLRRDPNTIGLMTDIKSRRRMAIWDDGAVARQLDAKLRNGVPSEVWI